MNQWNKVYGDILKFKKDNYRREDIEKIQEVANGLLQGFIAEGKPIVASAINRRVVKGIVIECKEVAENNRYIDLNTINIQLVV